MRRIASHGIASRRLAAHHAWSVSGTICGSAFIVGDEASGTRTLRTKRIQSTGESSTTSSGIHAEGNVREYGSSFLRLGAITTRHLRGRSVDGELLPRRESDKAKAAAEERALWSTCLGAIADGRTWDGRSNQLDNFTPPWFHRQCPSFRGLSKHAHQTALQPHLIPSHYITIAAAGKSP